MVSATPSGGWLQSSPVIPELGFCLGTRAQMFWLEEGHPAALAPGKRPRTTLTPTLALRDGEPYLAWGTPGGDQQDQWITQFFLRHVHAGLNLQEAIDAPAWHSDHFPSSFWPRTARPGVLVVEGRVPREPIAELKRPRSHRRGRSRLGRKAGSPPPRATAAAAAPPPIRAACRVMRRDGDTPPNALAPEIIARAFGRGDRGRAQRFQTPHGGKRRLRAQRHQAVAERKPLAPQTIDHRVVCRRAGIRALDRRVFEEFARSAPR